MNFYLLLPLLSCVALSALAVAVLARDSTRRASRLGAAVALLGAWWALCEVLWSSAHDPTAVMRLIKAAGLGWMFIGPAILHLVVELAGHPVRERRWLIPVLYTLPAALLVTDLSTDWVHTQTIQTSWGWGWEVGPLFIVPFLYAGGAVVASLVFAYRQLQIFASPAERRQTMWLFAGLLVPLFVASFTDGVAPMLGYQVPRLGAGSISLLAVSVGWTFKRYGYSMLAPGAFASEILSTIAEGVALLRLDGRVHSANASMGWLLGTRPAALEGMPIRDVCSVALTDVSEPVLEQECELLPHGADPVPVSVCTSLVRDKRQNLIGVVLVARDLREVANLRSRLITSERLASVGQLAAGIAHEINNPVAYVHANLGSLRSLLAGIELASPVSEDLAEEFSEGRDLIEESLDGVNRVAAIVRDVKSFSHTGEAGLEGVEVHPLLDSVLRVASPQLRYGASVVRDFEPVPSVLGSSQQLQQVFLNLVMNASQAVDDDGTIRIATRSEDDRVVIEVHDDGCGIAPDQIARIFDPFFTTNAVGEGTGLGLSISYQIVTRHRGELSVESQPGSGTCFRVELPTA